MVLPGDAQNPPEAMQMEEVESAFLAGVQCPGFTAVQQCADDAGLVDLHLGVGGQHGVVPYSCCKAGHCC